MRADEHCRVPRHRSPAVRHIRTSPTKVRQVLTLIQGQDVATRATRSLLRARIAAELGKLLDSAIANAEHNDNMPADELFVAARASPTRVRRGSAGGPARVAGRPASASARATSRSIVARFDDDELERRRRREAGRWRRRVAARRAVAGRRREPVHDHEHDEHDHDHDHDHEEHEVDDVTEVDESRDGRGRRPTRPSATPAKKRRPRRRRRRRLRPRRRRPTKTDAKKAPADEAAAATTRRRARREDEPAAEERTPDMGQKVNPYGFRLGITTDWKSRWFADGQEYKDSLIEDWQIRDYLRSSSRTRPSAGSRSSARVTACGSTSTPPAPASSSAAAAPRPTVCAPGCSKITGNPKIHFNIQEIKQPELDATLDRAGRRRSARRPRLLPPGDEARACRPR